MFMMLLQAIVGYGTGTSGIASCAYVWSVIIRGKISKMIVETVAINTGSERVCVLKVEVS